jgi:hypothetical protein
LTLLQLYNFYTADISDTYYLANSANSNIVYDASLSISGLITNTPSQSGNGSLYISGNDKYVNAGSITTTTGGISFTFYSYIPSNTTANFVLFDYGNGLNGNNILMGMDCFGSAYTVNYSDNSFNNTVIGSQTTVLSNFYLLNSLSARTPIQQMSITDDGNVLFFSAQNAAGSTSIFYMNYNRNTGVWDTSYNSIITGVVNVVGFAVNYNGTRLITGGVYANSTQGSYTASRANQQSTFSTFTRTLDATNRSYMKYAMSVDGKRISSFERTSGNIFWADWRDSSNNYGAYTTIITGYAGSVNTIGNMCFSRDKGTLVALIKAGNQANGVLVVYKWNTNTYTQSYTLTVTGSVNSGISLSLDSALLYMYMGNSTIKIFSLNGTEIASVPIISSGITGVGTPTTSYNCSISPDNSTLYFSEGYNIFSVPITFSNVKYLRNVFGTSINNDTWNKLTWSLTSTQSMFYLNGNIVNTFTNRAYPKSISRSKNYIGYDSNTQIISNLNNFNGVYYNDFAVYTGGVISQ